jgi:hypothetical protein
MEGIQVVMAEDNFQKGMEMQANFATETEATAPLIRKEIVNIGQKREREEQNQEKNLKVKEDPQMAVDNGLQTSKKEEAEIFVEQQSSLAELIVLLKWTMEKHAHAEMTAKFINILTEINTQLMETKKENQELRKIIMENTIRWQTTKEETKAAKTAETAVGQTKAAEAPTTTETAVGQSNKWPTPQMSREMNQKRKQKRAPVQEKTEGGVPAIPATEETAANTTQDERNSIPTVQKNAPSNRWGKTKFTKDKAKDMAKDMTKDEVLRMMLQDATKTKSFPKITKVSLEAMFSSQYLDLAPMARWKMLLMNIGTGVTPKNILVWTARQATIFLTEEELEMMKQHLPPAVTIVPEVNRTEEADMKRLAAAYLYSFCVPLRKLVLMGQDAVSNVRILNEARLMKLSPQWKDRPGVVKTATIQWDLRNWKQQVAQEKFMREEFVQENEMEEEEEEEELDKEVQPVQQQEEEEEEELDPDL